MHQNVLRTAVIITAVIAAFTATANAIEHDKPGGPPYRPAGNRLVFTTWQFVQPGKPGWQDAQGNILYGGKDKRDPNELHFIYRDWPRGVRITAESATIVGPIIKREKQWEKMALGMNSVLFDEGKYRAWGSCRSDTGKWFNCYFESSDGKNWTRPNLGLVEFNGSKDNNLITGHAYSVFKDPTSSPAERYKATWHSSIEPAHFEKLKNHRAWSTIATEMDPGKVHVIMAAVSPDGINWTDLPEPIGIEPTDTQVIAYYDRAIKKYVMFTRSYMLGVRADGFNPPSPSEYQAMARRAVGRTESNSFTDFPPALTIIEPGPDMPPTDQYYSNCYTTVPGAPDHHLMFPMLFHLDSDNMSFELHSSYDGRLWHKVPGQPMPRLPDYGGWNGGCAWVSPNLVELPDGDWILPYTGYDIPHKYPASSLSCDAGLAVWPKGRMVAMEARTEGQFATEPLVVPTGKLKINAVAQRTGGIWIEVADATGKTIPGRSFEDCTPIIGDHAWAAATWKTGSDLGVKPSTPIMLRFKMTRARLYGIEFAD